MKFQATESQRCRPTVVLQVRRPGLANRSSRRCSRGQAEAGTDAGDTAPLFVGYSDDNLRWAYDQPLRDERGVSRPQAFGSPHIGGVNMSFADGSVRSIPYDIDPTVHTALAGRSDRIVVTPP